MSHPFRVAFEAGDLRAAVDALAPGVVLRSPITSAFRFEGRDQVAEVLEVVLDTFEDFRYTAEMIDGDTHVLLFHTRVGKAELEGADVMRVDGEGKVREIIVFIRPLPGLTALTAALGPRLARRRGRRASAAALGLMTRPLAAVSRLGDPLGARLVGAAKRAARGTR